MANNRVLRSSWNVHGTETGRWSSGKNRSGGGLNAQTVPKVVRWAFVPPEGHVFIQPDLSQAEARVVAYLAGCQPLIDLFNDSTKSIHMENAMAILGYYPKKDSNDYVLAKKCVHAANYKISERFLSTIASIPVSKAGALLKAYFLKYPEIPMWHDWTMKMIGEVGELKTPFGRKRLFAKARAELLILGKVSNDSWKDAIAYVPQATVPDVTNHGMVNLWKSPVGASLRFHQQGHDSFLCSAPAELLGEVARTLKECLTVPFEITDITGYSRTLTIPVDLAWGFSWGATKGWKGEERADHAEWETWLVEKKVIEDLKGNLL